MKLFCREEMQHLEMAAVDAGVKEDEERKAALEAGQEV